MNRISIGGRRIGVDEPPFVIAEMSGNHDGKLEKALAIVRAAAAAGAHAIKLQTYTADTMTLDLARGDFYISDPASLWHGRTLYELYSEAATPWDWHRPIFDLCRELGLTAFSSPFDASAVEFLEALGVPCYKIASFENADLPLIEKAAATGKPLIISSGMASEAELEEAVSCARSAGCRDLVLLKCTSSYPASPSFSNLRTIPAMREAFNCEVGLSDHTPGIGAAIAAVSLGASVIEKHFTLSRAEGGVDAAFSLEPDELKMLVSEVEQAWQALGAVHYGPTEPEKSSLQFRRSLYVARDMRAGDVFDRTNLRAIRPGRGLPPKYYGSILGKKVTRDVPMGTPLSWDLVQH